MGLQMFAYTRFPKHDFTLFVSQGSTQVDEWIKTLINYGTEGITKYELFDLRQHTYLFSTQELEQILHLTTSNIHYRPPETKTALVVDKTAMYGVSRVYDILAEVEGIEGLVTQVFYSIDEALMWLGEQAREAIRDGA